MIRGLFRLIIELVVIVAVATYFDFVKPYDIQNFFESEDYRGMIFYSKQKKYNQRKRRREQRNPSYKTQTNFERKLKNIFLG